MTLETSQRPEVLRALENALPKSTLLCDAMSDNALAQVIDVLIDGNSLPASFIAKALECRFKPLVFTCGRPSKGGLITHDGAYFRLESAGQRLFDSLGIPFARNTTGAVLTKDASM